ncbi:unnamed protein product, partial [Symbiodinium sp. KB8]
QADPIGQICVQDIAGDSTLAKELNRSVEDKKWKCAVAQIWVDRDRLWRKGCVTVTETRLRLKVYRRFRGSKILMEIPMQHLEVVAEPNTSHNVVLFVGDQEITEYTLRVPNRVMFFAVVHVFGGTVTAFEPEADGQEGEEGVEEGMED